MLVHSMKRLASILLPLLFIASTLVMPHSSVSAAAAQTDSSREVNRVLAEISRAERNEDWHLLYDLMLPDARMLISRTAFVNWYPTVAPAAPADVLKISGVDFEDMSYDLTGTEFDNVAIANYTYQDAEGNTVERQVMLAEVDGIWRWMPDITESDASEINAMGGYTVKFTSAYSTEIYQDLDTYWAQIFSDWGKEYRSPADMIGVNVAGTPTGCGEIDNPDEVFAHYCTRDETIYFNPDAREYIIDRFGPPAWDMVMAHEWAHHIQNISGMYVTKSPELYGGNYSIEHELQADCLSGTFMQDGTVRGLFSSGDIKEMDRMIDLFGDQSGTKWDDVTAHGTAKQRRDSLNTGMNDGLRGCNLRAN